MRNDRFLFGSIPRLAFAIPMLVGFAVTLSQCADVQTTDMPRIIDPDLQKELCIQEEKALLLSEVLAGTQQLTSDISDGDCAGSQDGYFETWHVYADQTETVLVVAESDFDNLMRLVRIEDIQKTPEGHDVQVEVIDQNDDQSASDSRSRVAATLEAGEDYFLVLSGFNEDETGPYELEVSPTATPPESPPTGSIEVQVSSTGQAPPTFTATLNGAKAKPIPANETAQYTDILTGEYAVELTGLGGCSVVEGDNPEDINVLADQTATVSFAVECPLTGGTLRVTTDTIGDSPDSSYSVSIDDSSQGTIGPTTSKDFSVDSGSHTVELGDVASNCTVTSTNPTTVDVSDGSTATVTFDLDCPTPEGTIRVTTNTIGNSPDSSFSVSIDDSSQGTIGPTTSKDFSVLAGSHTVELGDIASNCTATSTNPATVNVSNGGTATVTFDLDCPTPEGTIRVTTNTIGNSPDPSYALSIDGNAQGTIDSSTSKNYSVLAGSHTVLLGDIAGNCTLLSTNPQTVNVADGGTAAVTFDLDCPTPQGTLRVGTTTSGASPDASYGLSIDGNAQGTIGPNALKDYSVLAGSHTVLLSDIAGNCSLLSANPQTVNVADGGTTTVTFDLDCPTPQGTLRVDTTTSGASPDPSYAVSIDGSSQGTIGPNALKDYSVLAGSHTVSLGDIAGNCNLLSANPQTVNVADGGTTTVTFDLDCPAPQGTLRVDTTTSGASPDPSYTVSIDGSSQGTIGPNALKDYSVLVGSHTVSLGDIAGNCNLLSSNPQTVNVADAGTTTVTFNLDCPPPPGTLRVVTQTTGSDIDPTYTVSIDGNPPDLIGPSNWREYILAEGVHTVRLGDIAGNCQVQTDVFKTAIVNPGSTTFVTFNLTCVPLVPGPPVLSNLREELIILNQCGDPYPNHSWYKYTFDYTDPNGDVTETDTRVFVLICWSNGCQPVYESASAFNTFTGDPFSGSITVDNCLEFGISQWAEITIEIWDASGTESVNQVTVHIEKPSGAN